MFGFSKKKVNIREVAPEYTGMWVILTNTLIEVFKNHYRKANKTKISENQIKILVCTEVTEFVLGLMLYGYATDSRMKALTSSKQGNIVFEHIVSSYRKCWEEQKADDTFSISDINLIIDKIRIGWDKSEYMYYFNEAVDAHLKYSGDDDLGRTIMSVSSVLTSLGLSIYYLINHNIPFRGEKTTNSTGEHELTDKDRKDATDFAKAYLQLVMNQFLNNVNLSPTTLHGKITVVE